MKRDNFNETDFEEIEEIEEFGDWANEELEQNYEVEELTDEEAEEISGGAYTAKKALGGAITGKDAAEWLKKDSAKKGYKKHCGGIRLETQNSQISVSRVNARIGTVDKVYVTAPSKPIAQLRDGAYNGPKTFTVARKSGKIGLVTLELWGHQKGEAKNYRYMVLRVTFK